MNRNDFLNMIENTVPVNRTMIGEVYELIDIFPYFQSAHLLLLKGLHTNADVKFENQLRNSKIHIKKDNDLKEEIVIDTQQTVIESAKNSEYMINEIEKNSDETGSGEKPDTLNQTPGQSVMIATEPDNTDPAGVIFLLEEDTIPSEDKVVFMDPGFRIPEYSDLLELDLDEDHEIIF